MIFDQENMFYDKTKTVATSNVIANVGGGDAVDPLFLAVCSDAAETAALSFVLETSDQEGFGAKDTLATFTSAANAKGLIIAAKVPYGAKAFLRLTCAGTPKGNITAGLTETVPNWKF